ncbi:hypothetical protein ATO7_13928 [Oceanococcus atlanticus]|uniref:phosphatidyl-N-methylethanolamine N-methyltransferase n=1 Tax=Oceanococcus atlanticus TaxID=1317117 RepID=A0A1Y1SCR3_9GAMM|nr:methyltransferase [Oceanococcus atlanticus]ORE86401.1 hypothetical protein ATO7_13928 [Oceanococcus atlanticus]
MSFSLFLAFFAAAVVLSFERLTYIYVWRRPRAFASRCRRWRLAADPVAGLERLFYLFKVIQILVFAAWIFMFSAGQWPQLAAWPFLSGGIVLILVGQMLNLMTFWRLGRVGIFYGVRFGHEVAWCRQFPFSVFRNPQYLGTVLSIWGLFIAVRFEQPDWLLIPLLQTLYYALGAHFEKDSPRQPGAYVQAEVRATG